MSIEKMNFKRWVHKVLPAVYDESLSYYELLCKVIAKLNETIDLSNNTAEGLKELQDYVNNYFEDLDVQEEINNKLDEMAESGELAELIAQYLEAQAVIGFNNNAGLAAATNLANGSFAKTMGRTTYNDGQGAFYRIRTRLNSDDPDGDNLIALTETDNLVAEKIPYSCNYDLKNDIINELTNERILCVGDSYGVGTTYGGTINGWCDRLKTLRNLSDDNYIKLVEGSSGFTRAGLSGHTFQSLVEANISSISHPETITKIVVCGGHNEYESNDQALNTAIQSFIEYCNQHFVNAKIYIGMIGNDSNATSGGITVRNAIYTFILRSYQNSVTFGATYLSGIQNIMHDYNSFMSEDGIHPNNLGYRFLASYINNCLNNQYADYISPTYDETFTVANSDSTFTISNKIINDCETFSFNQINISYAAPTTFNGGSKRILSSSTPTNYAYHNQRIHIPISYYIMSNDNGQKFYGGTGELFIDNNGIYITNNLLKNDGSAYFNIPNVTGIFINPSNTIVENGIC